MRILGIDPGLVRTGWAVIEPLGRQARVLDCGLVAPDAAGDLPARLADGAARLRAVLAEHRPDLAVLEEVFTTPRHPRSALLMAHMRGVICLVVQEAGVPIIPLTATTVKQRITGRGHASKTQIQRMVLQLTGLEATGSVRSDVTDAIALALAGMHQTSHERRPDRARPAGDRWAELLRRAEAEQAARRARPLALSPPPTAPTTEHAPPQALSTTATAQRAAPEPLVATDRRRSLAQRHV